MSIEGGVWLGGGLNSGGPRDVNCVSACDKGIFYGLGFLVLGDLGVWGKVRFVGQLYRAKGWKDIPMRYMLMWI